MEMIKTYLNRQGVPIIRKCNNCVNFQSIENDSFGNGYCKRLPMLFAFTHEKSVYAIVKDFYLCESHQFVKETTLKEQSQEVELLPYLLDRNAKKKA